MKFNFAAFLIVFLVMSASVMASSLTSTSTYTNPDGLIAYWDFAQCTGTSATDRGDWGITGTLINTPTWVAGKYGCGLSFDGATQYVNATNNSILNPVSGLTMSVWIYRVGTHTGAATYVIFAKNIAGSTPEYGFGIYASDFYATANGNPVLDVCNPETVCLPANTWTYIAMTSDGSTLKVYINGVLYTSAAKTLATTGIGAVWIGGGAAYFNGRIDEPKIWNRALSAAEILNETFHYCPLISMNITTYNESSTSQSAAFNLVATNTTSSFSYSNANPFTDYYCNSTFPTGSVTISISNTSFYSPRYYYSTLAAGGSYNLSAYLLPLTDTYHITTSFITISGSLTITTATIVCDGHEA